MSKSSGKEERWKILSSDELREVLGPEQMVWVDEQENVWAFMGPFVATHVYNPEGVPSKYILRTLQSVCLAAEA